VSELASHPDMLVVIRRMIGDHADIGEALEAAGGARKLFECARQR
jgi:hypothetical protein